RFVFDRLVLVSPLPIRAQLGPTCSGIHQTVYAHADRSETDRELSRIQFSPGRSVPALRVRAANRARRLVFPKGDLRVNVSILGSARMLRAGERLRRSRTFFGTSPFPQNAESLGKSSFRQNAETSTLQACAPRIIATLLVMTTHAGGATLQERIDAAAP